MGILLLNFAPPPQRNPLQRAVDALKATGNNVTPADIPGLFFVNGQELTTGQVIHVSGINITGHPA